MAKSGDILVQLSSTALAGTGTLWVASIGPALAAARRLCAARGSLGRTTINQTSTQRAPSAPFLTHALLYHSPPPFCCCSWSPGRNVCQQTCFLKVSIRVLFCIDRHPSCLCRAAQPRALVSASADTRGWRLAGSSRLKAVAGHRMAAPVAGPLHDLTPAEDKTQKSRNRPGARQGWTRPNLANKNNTLVRSAVHASKKKPRLVARVCTPLNCSSPCSLTASPLLQSYRAGAPPRLSKFFLCVPKVCRCRCVL